VSNCEWPTKDPDELLDYDADWNQHMATGDLIAAVVWEITPDTTPPLVSELETYDNPTRTATIWLSGGLAGTDYKINCHVTSDSTPARQHDRAIGLTVRELI
jgi:hypothetical protein